MDPHDLWLVFAGFVASSVNAAAGGGTLLSFPSLLAIGLSPLAANATSMVALLPGSLASIWAYRGELRTLHGDALRILWPSLGGGILGAWLLVFLGERIFAAIVPALLLVSSAMLVAQPLVARWLRRRRGQKETAGAPEEAARFGTTAVLAGTFLVAVYAGYFGAGVGILFLAVMGPLLARPIDEVNALKVVSAALANGVAAITFVVLEHRHPTGALHYRAALPLAIGATLGGYLGVRAVRRLPPAALRAFAALVGVGIAFYLGLRK
ncbi:MAG: sulfite exporter TauE/SafE family protein [Myxococcales bacterium]